MFRWLSKSLGLIRDDPTPQTEYDPVYGLPRRAVEEWLARNPQLKEEHELLEWLARNPPLRREYEEARRQGLVTRGAAPHVLPARRESRHSVNAGCRVKSGRGGSDPEGCARPPCGTGRPPTRR